MTERMVTKVRAFDGSQADAEGLLAVERATFDECPYSPGQVRAMLAGGLQHAWLALARDVVVGFVVGFTTDDLHGPVWEVDLLAVDPAWQGHGLATRLVRASCAHGAAVSARTRSLVSVDNQASARVFRRAGFRAPGQPGNLFICRVQERSVPAAPSAGVQVRDVVRPAEPHRARSDSGSDPRGSLAADDGPRAAGCEFQAQRPLFPLQLAAGPTAAPQGLAELVEVQTLLYRGYWLESLSARNAFAREALIRETLVRARAAGLDEVGAVVPAGDIHLADTLQRAGFQSLGGFHRFEARLPLPGRAGPPVAVWSNGTKAPKPDSHV